MLIAAPNIRGREVRQNPTSRFFNRFSKNMRRLQLVLSSSLLPLLTIACSGDDPATSGSASSDSTSTEETGDAATSDTGETGDASETVDTTDTTSTSDTTDDGCAPGEQGCACEPGGACGVGLVCEADVCVPPPPSDCGDGNLDANEECDLGSANAEDGYCTPTCNLARCGDGLVAAWEACDDGNLDDTDGCTTVCTSASCGDGIVQAPEECDDGNASNGDACLNTCLAASCGDGFTAMGSEECDPANPAETDLCLATCELEVPASCGDTTVDAGEFCHALSPAVAVAQAPLHVEIGEVTGDSFADVVVLSRTGTLQVWAGDGAGGVSLSNTIDLPGEPWDAADPPLRLLLGQFQTLVTGVADDLDAAVLRGAQLHVLGGTGDAEGFAATPADYPVSGSNLAEYADMGALSPDANAIQSLIIADKSFVSNLGNDIYGVETLNPESGASSVQPSTPAPKAWLTVGDANGDEFMDPVFAVDDGSSTSVVDGETVASAISEIAQVTAPVGAHSGPGAVADSDGDDVGEVFVLQSPCLVSDLPSSCLDGRVLIAPSGGSPLAPGGGASFSVTVGKHPQGMELADVNGDDRLDIVTVDGSGGTVSVRLNDELHEFRAARTVETPAVQSNSAIAVGDLNSDGVEDFAIIFETFNLMYFVLSNP